MRWGIFARLLCCSDSQAEVVLLAARLQDLVFDLGDKQPENA